MKALKSTDSRGVPLTEADFERMRAKAKSVFRLDSGSVHGPGHWRNVEDTVMLIAPETGADTVVGRLFAIFHDCCRVDDIGDPDHGPRAASFIRSLLGTEIQLTKERGEILLTAVRDHTLGHTSDDRTIGTCWDADRLDLGRVGTSPEAKLMSTSAGKRIAADGTKYLYVIEKRRGQKSS